MGFFSDLKEDLTQAVNELLPEEEGAVMQPEQSAEETAKAPEQSVEALSLEEMLANIDSVQLPADEEEAAEQEPVETPEPVESPEPESMAEDGTDAVLDGEPEETEPEPLEAVEGSESEELPEPEPLPEPEKPSEAEPEEPPLPETMSETAETDVPDIDTDKSYKGAEKMETNAETEQERMVTDETAVITEGMQITGDMISTGSLDVIGTVTGNIDILGKLNITGYITGNSKASEVYAEGAKINGEVVSEGAVKIGEDSVIIGNITATYAVIAGAVKGDIDVHGPVLLDSTAIVMGNIRSKSVQINNGAVIEGMCSQCYADVSPTHFFDDYQPKTGKSKSKNN